MEAPLLIQEGRRRTSAPGWLPARSHESGFTAKTPKSQAGAGDFSSSGDTAGKMPTLQNWREQARVAKAEANGSRSRRAHSKPSARRHPTVSSFPSRWLRWPGQTSVAPSGLAVIFGRFHPGRWPGLCYCRPSWGSTRAAKALPDRSWAQPDQSRVNG
jgi:hypothetical protein